METEKRHDEMQENPGWRPSGGSVPDAWRKQRESIFLWRRLPVLVPRRGGLSGNAGRRLPDYGSGEDALRGECHTGRVV